MCTGKRSGLYVIAIPEDLLSVKHRIIADHSNASRFAGDGGGGAEWHSNNRKRVRSDILDEAVTVAFQTRVRRVIAAADADLIIVPRPVMTAAWSGDVATATDQTQLRGTNRSRRRAAAEHTVDTERLLSYSDISAHITDAARYLDIPIVRPSDHIAAVSGPEHRNTPQSHPIHSLLSLQLPLLHAITAQVALAPINVVLHDGPLLVEQVTSLCKAVAAVPMAPTPLRLYIITRDRASRRSRDGGSGGSGGGSGARSGHEETRGRLCDLLGKMERAGYLIAGTVLTLLRSRDERGGCLNPSVASVGGGGGRQFCSPFMTALRASASSSFLAQLRQRHQVLYLAPEVCHVSHSLMFYLHITAAKISSICHRHAQPLSPTATTSRDRWARHHTNAQVLGNLSASGLLLWHSLLQELKAVGKHKGSEGMEEEVMCNDASRFVSFERSEDSDASTSSHFLVSLQTSVI
jgi:hypothetical protein